MTTLHLSNLTIKKLADKNLKDYYLIVNNDNQEAFFCFEGMINKEGWQELEDNWEGIKEAEIEYNEREQGSQVYRRVIDLKVNNVKELWEVF